LFEVGVSSPKKNTSPHLHIHSGTPKGRVYPKHPLVPLTKENSATLLRYQPAQSPTLARTHGKEFHIRKNFKLPFSPKAQTSLTASNFFHSESGRNSPNELRDNLYEAREKEEHLDACLELKEPG
jgi:hypothetical protein